MKLLLLTILFLSFLSVSARSITDFGAIPNDGLPDTDAILSTLRAVEDDCGGEILIPKGEFLVDNIIFTDFYGGCGWIHLKIRGEIGAVIRISVGAGNTVFQLSSLKSLIVEDIVFLGVPVPVNAPDFIDAGDVFRIATIDTVNFDHVYFYGLAVTGAFIRSFNAQTVITDSQFSGNTAIYPNGAYIFGDRDVSGNAWQSIKVINCQFLDYANYKFDFITKTPVYLTGAYIKTVEPSASGNTQSRGVLEVRNSFFDEAAHTAIDAKDTLTVIIDDIGINLNVTTNASGIRLTNVTSAEIDRSVGDFSAGWFLTTQNVQRVRVSLLTFRNGAQFWKNLGSTYMVIGWCSPTCLP